MRIEAEIVVDADALKYLACVLEGYFSWRKSGTDLGFPQCGRVLGIPDPVENRRLLDLSDDHFTLVDQRYAALEEAHRQIIAAEYDNTGSVMQKARALGYVGPNAGAVIGLYRRDQHLAECDLYSMLLPDIEYWQSEKPMRRKG